MPDPASIRSSLTMRGSVRSQVRALALWSQQMRMRLRRESSERRLSRSSARLGASLAAFLVVAVGCGSAASTELAAAPHAAADGRIQIVATTSIWADIVSNVACGGLAKVETLIPVGGDPHAFEPSLADRGRLEAAALVVSNGLLLEEGLEDTIEAVEAAGTPVLRIAEHADTIRYSADADADAGRDPHVWFDPMRVVGVLPVLAEHLIDEVELDTQAVNACVAAYQDKLVALDIEISDLLAPVAVNDRKLVTNHDALGYFADRYDFEVIGTVIPAPSGLAEANPAQLETLAQLIEETGVKAVFADTEHSTDDAAALARRVGGVEVVPLLTGTLGQNGTEADTFVGLLRVNAVAIAEALS